MEQKNIDIAISKILYINLILFFLYRYKNKITELTINLDECAKEQNNLHQIQASKSGNFTSSYLKQTFLPLGSGNIISSYKRMRKCNSG